MGSVVEEGSQFRGLISREENFSMVKIKNPMEDLLIRGLWSSSPLLPLMNGVYSQQIKLAFIFSI